MMLQSAIFYGTRCRMRTFTDADVIIGDIGLCVEDNDHGFLPKRTRGGLVAPKKGSHGKGKAGRYRVSSAILDMWPRYNTFAATKADGFAANKTGAGNYYYFFK